MTVDWAAVADLVTLDDVGWHPLPHQIPPGGRGGIDWGLWLLLGGRGTGKTDASAHYVNDHMLGPPCDPRIPGGHRAGIVAPTLGDAFESCVDGPSGLKAHNPEVRAITKQGGSFVYWPNGAVARLFGSYTPQDVERLRAGGNRCIYWAEEVAAWRQLPKSWPHMRYGLRVGPHPHIVGSSTPKPRKFFVSLINADRTVTTHGTTNDNPYLAEEVRAELYKDYDGTRIGRQELLGEILSDTPGAIATLDQLDEGRVWEAPKLSTRVCSIDGAYTNTDDSDETGITVTGRAGDHAFMLFDASLKADVSDWAYRAIEVAIEWKCGTVLYEATQGSDANAVILRASLKQYNDEHKSNHHLTIKAVSPSLSKYDRALPLQQAIQQGRYHLVGSWPKYEEQLTNWTPIPDENSDEDATDDKKGKKDKSPDRMDSGVHGFRHVMGISEGRTVLTGKTIRNARISTI